MQEYYSLGDISGQSRLVVIATIISAVAAVFMVLISLPEAYIHSVTAYYLHPPKIPNPGKDAIEAKAPNKFSPSFDKRSRVYILRLEPKVFKIQFYAAYSSREANAALNKIKFANQDIHEIENLYIAKNLVTNKGQMFQIRLNFNDRDLANRFCDRFSYEKRGDCILIRN